MSGGQCVFLYIQGILILVKECVHVLRAVVGVSAAAAYDDGGQRLCGDGGGAAGVFAALVSFEVEGLAKRERAVSAVQFARLVDTSQVSVE